MDARIRKSQLQGSSEEGDCSKWRSEKRNNYSDGAKKVAEGTEKTKNPIEDINASADAFIKNFRKQLLIQRLQSIENYEQMLKRGL
ncbi:unnamed protein product [Sphenostylis stenocarpa]|uniref:Uncharacterized protein n=1 Tax=Sphenostylis stenocarpa TaxID=92480 RepID=A0AA86SHG1_9FABA|nr:unnamed protein product [Sphenostylis stenocarpa]